jgi:hypothetical protein
MHDDVLSIAARSIRGATVIFVTDCKVRPAALSRRWSGLLISAIIAVDFATLIFDARL